MNIVRGAGLVLLASFGAPGLAGYAELRGPNASHGYLEIETE